MERGIGWWFPYGESTAQMREMFEMYIRDCKPGAVLFYDSYGEFKADAIRLAYTYPATVIVYRFYIQGDRQHEYLTANAWNDHHDEFRGGPDNLFCSAANEAPTDKAAAWYMRVLEEAERRDINVSIAGFGTGQPSDAELPLLDPVLEFIAAHPKRAIIDCHEYFRALAWCDFAREAKHPSQWPTKAPTDNAALHLLGRFRRILARADYLKVKRPRIVIGEHGPDRVTAVPASVYGDTGGILSCVQTWRGWGVGDPELYGAALMKAAWDVFYKPYPEVIGVCFFSVSNHPTFWGEFNATFAPTFLNACRKGFARMDIYPPLPAPAYTFYITGPHTLTGNGVRIRSTADTSAPIITTLNSGAVVNVLSTGIVINDGFGWQEVESGGLRGHMALHGTGVTWTLTPVAAPPDDRNKVLLECAEELEATAAKLRALAARSA